MRANLDVSFLVRIKPVEVLLAVGENVKHRAELNLVPDRQAARMNGSAVHECPVPASEIEKIDKAVARVQFGVAPRNRRVPHRQVALPRPAEEAGSSVKFEKRRLTIPGFADEKESV